jgi:hypothetical protein
MKKVKKLWKSERYMLQKQATLTISRSNWRSWCECLWK